MMICVAGVMVLAFRGHQRVNVAVVALMGEFTTCQIANRPVMSEKPNLIGGNFITIGDIPLHMLSRRNSRLSDDRVSWLKPPPHVTHPREPTAHGLVITGGDR